jgi:hypothetical protein
MRLKEDKSNWKASNILRKIALLPDEPRTHKKKSTRKWCKGVVGIKHDYQKATKPFIPGYIIDISKCARCTKEKYGIRQVKK